MSMVVEITNLTDAVASKVRPTQISIYSQKLNPGEVLKLPAHMVDARLRELEKSGYIGIGPVPSWYAASKAKRGRVLSADDVIALTNEKAKRLAKKNELKDLDAKETVRLKKLEEAKKIEEPKKEESDKEPSDKKRR
jgi:hypothetical protein